MLVNFLTDTRENSLFLIFKHAFYQFSILWVVCIDTFFGVEYIQQFPFVSCQINRGYGVSH